jgi:Tat protein translocase TatB subunit
MPSVGPLEILVIAVIALVVFGPDKLPEIARQVGRTATELRRMATEVKDEFDGGFDMDEPVSVDRLPDGSEDGHEMDEPEPSPADSEDPTGPESAGH